MTMATPVDRIMAAPTPCTTRRATRLVTDQARDAHSEKITKAAVPQTKVRLRPRMSASRPTGSRMAARGGEAARGARAVPPRALPVARAELLATESDWLPLPLPASEARQAAKQMLAAATASPKRIFPYLPQVQLTEVVTQLVYLPCVDKGHVWAQPETGVTIAKNILRFGRSL